MLQTCYRETGAMDFGSNEVSGLRPGRPVDV